MSRTQRTYQQLLSAETSKPLSAPNYDSKLDSKSDSVDTHSQLVSLIHSIDICAYSNGSPEGHGRSFYGYVLQRDRKAFEKGNGVLHGNKVYDAEYKELLPQ